MTDDVSQKLDFPLIRLSYCIAFRFACCRTVALCIVHAEAALRADARPLLIEVPLSEAWQLPGRLRCTVL